MLNIEKNSAFFLYIPLQKWRFRTLFEVLIVADRMQKGGVLIYKRFSFSPNWQMFPIPFQWVILPLMIEDVLLLGAQSII